MLSPTRRVWELPQGSFPVTADNSASRPQHPKMCPAVGTVVEVNWGLCKNGLSGGSLCSLVSFWHNLDSQILASMRSETTWKMGRLPQQAEGENKDNPSGLRPRFQEPAFFF